MSDPQPCDADVPVMHVHPPGYTCAPGTGGRLHTCASCASVVADADAHTEWHVSIWQAMGFRPSLTPRLGQPAS